MSVCARTCVCKSLHSEVFMLRMSFHIVVICKMATATSITDSPNNCSICLDVFTKPKLLSCFHTFCADCVQQHLDKHGLDGKFNCPVCRTEITIPPSGSALDFQTNFYLDGKDTVTGRSGLSSPVASCAVCGEGSLATSRCLECDENYCVTCATSHTKMKLSREHSVVDIATLHVDARTFCVVHKIEEVTLVCMTCDQLICKQCKSNSHNTHSFQQISDVAHTTKDNMRKAIYEAKGHNGILSQTQSDLVQQLSLLDHESKSDIKQIDDRAVWLHGEIDRVCQRLKEERKLGNREDELSIGKQQGDIGKQLDKYSTLLLKATQLLDSVNDGDVVKNGKSLTSQLSHRPYEATAVPLATSPSRYVKPVSDVLVRSLFGKVVTTQHAPTTDGLLDT
jgi:hypothetical protein